MAMRSLWERLRSRSALPRAVAEKLVGFATWVPVLIVIKWYIAEPVIVNGPSMYPLLNSDRDSTLRKDVVLVYKWLPSLTNLERGMVVTLRSPVHPEKVAIKRIVAVAGDRVQTKAPYPVPSVLVPKGHVWVEGDGPPGSSMDSNTYGPVSARLLEGRVTHVLFPFSKFGALNWREHKRPLVE